MEVRHQGDKEETFIQTVRRGGDRQPGLRELAARQWLADQARWQIVEWGRPGCSWQTPQGGGWQTLQPHIHTKIDQEEWLGSKADHATQGSSSGK